MGSKEIEVEEVENGFIIRVKFYEKIEHVLDLIQVNKIYVAESEEIKDKILNELGVKI
jgi:hypothetical protein